MAFKPCSRLLADLIQAGAEKRWQMEYKGVVSTGDTFGGRTVGPAAWQSADKRFILLMFREAGLCEYDLLQADPESTTEMVDFMGSYGHSPDELLAATRVAFTANAAHAVPPPDTTPRRIGCTLAGHCDAGGEGGLFDATATSPDAPLIVLGRTEADGLLRSVVFFENLQIPPGRVGSAVLAFTADGGEILVRDLTPLGAWTGSDYAAWGEWADGRWRIPPEGLDLSGLEPPLILDGVTHLRFRIDPEGNGGAGLWITVNDTGGQPVGSLYTEAPFDAPTVFLVPCTPVGPGRMLNHVNISLNDAVSTAGCDEIAAVAKTAGQVSDPMAADIGLTLDPAPPTTPALRAALLADQRPLRTFWDLRAPWTPGDPVRSPDIAPMLNTLLTDNAYTPGMNLALVLETRFPDKTITDMARQCKAGCGIFIEINWG
ncbi:hypothetical protein [Desulfococcus sp.]|uniref:hypothetical protein n=1 Tax=Desulfococcus sp. TaxID=2025834 RepID=UPI003D0EFC01